MVEFRSFANRFVMVILMLVGLLALTSPGLAQLGTAVPPAATNTAGFSTVVPRATASFGTAVPQQTPVVGPVVITTSAASADDSGISNETFSTLIDRLAKVIITLIVVAGLVQGKSTHDLARSQPVQWGVTAAANVAALTPGKDDDEKIKKLADQLGYEILHVDGVLTVKPKADPVSG
jgi:uncharacterized membrane protein